MSIFKVPLTTIKRILPHPNADRLEIAEVYGWKVVVSKGLYAPSDIVLYVPVDSILPSDIESIVFPEGSKIKLEKSRVRSIKIRGVVSQGLIINPKDVLPIELKGFGLEWDHSEFLKIKKYEPPAPIYQESKETRAPGERRKAPNIHFREYNGLNNIKWMPEYFNETDEVVIQEKLHGSHCRAMKAPKIPKTWWQHILKRFGLLNEYEDLYGSNTVDITNKKSYSGYYGKDIYGRVLTDINAFDKMKPGERIHGEVIGHGIQKNYNYGCKPGELKFVLFDVAVMQSDGTHKWLNPEEVEAYAKERGFDFVPILYRGKWDYSLAENLSKGPSVYCPEQKTREGIVIKRRYYYDHNQNKEAIKMINEDYYLDRNNTEFH